MDKIVNSGGPPLAKLETFNRVLACTPFPKEVKKSGLHLGLAAAADLVKLTLVIAADNYSVSDAVSPLEAGVEVYIHAKHSNAPWATEVMKIDGVEFILVPSQEVVAIRNGY